MNNQLIENIITSNSIPCPEFTYENPVLDRNVAKALSKSFVKILNITQQNSNISNNLRLSILENVRKMCQVEPENHLKVDENFTTLILDFYEQIVKDSRTVTIDSTERSLDAFLIRNLKDMNLNSSYKSSLNPEVVQALINLNKNGVYLDAILKDIIHWKCTDTKNARILKDLWVTNRVNMSGNIAEDISIKLKPEIEKCVLEICHTILNEKDPNIEGMFNSESVKNLIIKASNSSNCFKICCGVCNYIFIMTNFDRRIQTFIQLFIERVKDRCSCNTLSVLYPTHLSHIIVLLDVDAAKLPMLPNGYMEPTKKYLSKIKGKSKNDFIMLLSHFPQWFDCYYSEQKS